MISSGNGMNSFVRACMIPSKSFPPERDCQMVTPVGVRPTDQPLSELYRSVQSSNSLRREIYGPGGGRGFVLSLLSVSSHASHTGIKSIKEKKKEIMIPEQTVMIQDNRYYSSVHHGMLKNRSPP